MPPPPPPTPDVRAVLNTPLPPDLPVSFFYLGPAGPVALCLQFSRAK